MDTLWCPLSCAGFQGLSVGGPEAQDGGTCYSVLILRDTN